MDWVEKVGTFSVGKKCNSSVKIRKKQGCELPTY